MEETYRVVAHDGGFAYTAGGTLSETFATRAQAVAAARHAAAAQSVAGETVTITYETADGVWHTEVADGRDRPETIAEV